MPLTRRDAASIEEAAHALLRAGTGLLFLQHGLQKVFGLLGGTAVPLASMLGIAGMLELVGGALLILGLWTRPVALVLAIEMLAAVVIAHLPRGGWPIQNGGELPLLYAVVFLVLAAWGGGSLSVDARLTRGRRITRERL
jgi:putative oxidoreductase